MNFGLGVMNKDNFDFWFLISNLFRAVARPIVTVIFAATIAQVVTRGIDAPDWFLGLAIPVILWWFGERTVKGIKEKK